MVMNAPENLFLDRRGRKMFLLHSQQKTGQHKASAQNRPGGECWQEYAGHAEALPQFSTSRFRTSQWTLFVLEARLS